MLHLLCLNQSKLFILTLPPPGDLWPVTSSVVAWRAVVAGQTDATLTFSIGLKGLISLEAHANAAVYNATLTPAATVWKYPRAIDGRGTHTTAAASQYTHNRLTTALQTIIERDEVCHIVHKHYTFKAILSIDRLEALKFPLVLEFWNCIQIYIYCKYIYCIYNTAQLQLLQGAEWTAKTHKELKTNINRSVETTIYAELKIHITESVNPSIST